MTAPQAGSDHSGRPHLCSASTRAVFTCPVPSENGRMDKGWMLAWRRRGSTHRDRQKAEKPNLKDSFALKHPPADSAPVHIPCRRVVHTGTEMRHPQAASSCSLPARLCCSPLLNHILASINPPSFPIKAQFCASADAIKSLLTPLPCLRQEMLSNIPSCHSSRVKRGGKDPGATSLDLSKGRILANGLSSLFSSLSSCICLCSRLPLQSGAGGLRREERSLFLAREKSDGKTQHLCIF